MTIDALALGREKAMMHALVEVDVTRARTLISARRGSGGAQSFTAFVAACLGRAVARHPQVHAMPDLLGRLVSFADVDISTIVEIDVDGRPFGLAHVVRAANRRSPSDIHAEIHELRDRGLDAVATRTVSAAGRIGRLPGVLRRALFRMVLRFPQIARRMTGSVTLTAVGMFGGGIAWGVAPPAIHSLSVVVGGIGVRHSSDGPREILCLTVSADHAVIDGAPLARFVRDLRALLEAADGLEV